MADSYGRSRLSRDVSLLKEKLKDVETQCVDSYDHQALNPWIQRIKLRPRSGVDCQKMIWGEVKYADYLRPVQKNRLELSDEDVDYKTQHELLHSVQRTILGEQFTFGDL